MKKPNLKKIANNEISNKLIILILIVLGIFFTVAFLYVPAKNFYIASRENDKLRAQYESLRQTNERLEKDIESLKTEEGIKQRAYEKLGVIQEGEHAGVVNDSSDDIKAENASKDATSRIAYKLIKAPPTWYSPFFNFIFDVKD